MSTASASAMAASSWPSSWFSARGAIGSSTSSSIRTTCCPRAVTRVLEVVGRAAATTMRSEEHTSELQSQSNLVCRLLLEKKKKRKTYRHVRVIESDYEPNR